ncbi:MAG TPA: hypothetical protein VGL72_12920 [Bryobacteraceae bacterium]|jgi:hypothetical protein
MIVLISMFASYKRRWLILAAVVALTAVASFHAYDPSFGVAQHLIAILPCIGTLALLPSDPGSWITPETRVAVALDVFVPAVPPRAPPV